MKVIEKHYNNNVNESGMVILQPQETNVLLTKDFKYLAFNANNAIGFKFSKNEPLKSSKHFSIRDEKKTFYISNNTKEEITIKYSCLH